MNLSRTVSEINVLNGDFSQKIAKFSRVFCAFADALSLELSIGARSKKNYNDEQFFPPRVLNAPAEGVPVGWVPTPGVKKLDWWGYQTVKTVLR